MNRHHPPVRTAGLALVLLLVAVLAAPATAGWFGLGKDDDETTRTPPPRFDHHPSLSFHAGTLERSVRSGWSLGGSDLVITRNTRIRRLDDPAASVHLNAGAEIVAMGARQGDVLVCRQILVQPYVATSGLSGLGWTPEQIVWSTSDPTVGVGTGPY